MMRTPQRRGLTLIELVVVLVVLVALAGIVIPMLPSMLGRAHTSAGATNMGEIVKWVQSYEHLFTDHPDEWDALTDGTDLVKYLPSADGGTTLVGGSITAATLTAPEMAALVSAGVENIHLMSQTPNSPTFDPYANLSTAPTSLVANPTTKLALLDPLAANEKMGLSPTGKYVVFGVGKRSRMVGRVMAEPPVVFADEDLIDPSLKYGRFLVVYQVAENGTALSRARFVGSVSMHPGEIDGIGQHLHEYYDTARSQQ